MRIANRSTLALAAVVALVVMSTYWLRLNVSPSVPVGLYRLTAVPTPLEVGMLVILPVPASVRPWHSAWLPLLKPVAAVAGDEVCMLDERLWVNGVGYGPLHQAAAGTPLPWFLEEESCITVDSATVFLASPMPRSLDGRYLGMTPITTLTARAVPVITWR